MLHSVSYAFSIRWKWPAPQPSIMHNERDTMDLKAAWPELLPRAVDWAKMQQRLIQESGRPLSSEKQRLAARVGVSAPEEVRVWAVASIPTPGDPLLASACERTGFLGSQTIGLTLFRGIYLRRDYLRRDYLRRDARHRRRLLAHELRHVHQHEERGSIASFLSDYLQQVLEYGYDDAPLEVDARTAARHALAGRW